MKLIEYETYEYKGITIKLSDDGITEAAACEGIDILRLLSNAIDRMRYVTENPEDFQISCHISNPICKSDKCRFVVDIIRI